MAAISSLPPKTKPGDTGAAYIFDSSGAQLHRLEASDAAANYEFGQGVGINGNLAVVSAPGANLFRGQVYLFDVTTGMQIGDPVAPVAGELSPGDEFGNSLGFDGTNIIAGIDRAGIGGAAYIFDTAGNQIRKLEPPIDPGTQQPVRGFGRQVAISNGVALVGATPDADVVFPGEIGRAYLFDVATGNLLHELLPNDSQGEDLFGEDLDLSGNLALVGARHEAALGTINTAYLFDVTTGEEVAQLMPGPDVVAQDEALEGIALDGTFAVGGVESYDSPGFNNNGIVLIFDADAGTNLVCDLDADSFCDFTDLRMLYDEISAGATGGAADIDGNNIVDNADITAWLAEAGTANGKEYKPGDTNLDGDVSGADFTTLALNFGSVGLAPPAEAYWDNGNFDGNAGGSFAVGGSDFTALASNFGHTSVSSVPEPGSLAMTLLLVSGLAMAFRNARK